MRRYYPGYLRSFADVATLVAELSAMPTLERALDALARAPDESGPAEPCAAPALSP